MTDQGSKAKMWKAMRALGTFTSPELATISGVSHGYVMYYIKILRNAGYIRREHKQKTGTPRGTFWVYRLIKNTGPKPPTTRIVIYDPNLEGRHVD